MLFVKSGIVVLECLVSGFESGLFWLFGGCFFMGKMVCVFFMGFNVVCVGYSVVIVFLEMILKVMVLCVFFEVMMYEYFVMFYLNIWVG